MSGFAGKLARSFAIIDEAIQEHSPSHVFGLFSGGHDSLCSTHLLSLHEAFSGACHINTTIGIEETRAFVRRESAERGWGLREYFPPKGYREIVLKHGFPGPGAHQFMYSLLKERCVRQIVRENKRSRFDRVGLVTGVRLSESERRMGHVQPIQRVGSQLWIAPILHWDDDDKLEFMSRHALPRNPVVDNICMSGECLCGAFAKKEELLEIELYYPETAALIRGIEREAEAAGVHAKWGTRPPKSTDPATAGGMLCTSCNRKNFQADLFIGEAA